MQLVEIHRFAQVKNEIACYGTTNDNNVWAQ
jgi:hypothetical protein